MNTKLPGGMSDALPPNTTWPEFLTSLNLIKVPAGDLSMRNHWTGMHDWCRKQFGEDYTWTGSVFWFAKKEDAILFALRWGS